MSTNVSLSVMDRHIGPIAKIVDRTLQAVPSRPTAGLSRCLVSTIDESSSKMPSPIFREIDRGHIGNVRKHLSINPTALHATTSTEGQTPLHRAAVLGNADMVRELLAHDAKCDVADKYGNTPLHLACQSGSLDAVLALLGPGMRHTLKLKNRDGQTPLHIAVLVGTKETVHELVAAGASIDAKDKDGHAPLDLITGNQEEMMQALSIDPVVHETESSGEPQPFVRNLSPITPRAQRSQSNLAYDNTGPSHPTGRRLKHLSSSPDKGYAKYSDVTQRSLPRKQLQLHEMAIQGLQSELQDLGFRADNIEHFLNESQEHFDKLEGLSSRIDNQDRQLAELDQRLKFQEAHLRELRPRVNNIGDESRHNKQESLDLREMVETLKETARVSLSSVLERVQEWEAATINLKEEARKQNQNEEGHQFQINHLEQQIIDAHRLVKEAKTVAERSSQMSIGLEKKLQEVQDRMSAVEDFIKEACPTVTTEESLIDEDDPETKKQIHTLLEHYEALKVMVEKTAAQSDRIEEMYKEQTKYERNRRTEQDLELSQRESRILELRRIALEEENQRRDFGKSQEEQRQQMATFESKIKEAISAAQKEAQCRSVLEEKIKIMEVELESMHRQLEVHENKMKGGCCRIS